MRTNFQRCLGGRVWFSTSPVPGVRITEPSQSSAGRRFRDIPLDHKLLRHLDALLMYAEEDEAWLPELIEYVPFFAPRLDTLGPHLALLRPHMPLLLPHMPVIARNVDAFIPFVSVSANADVLLHYFGWLLRVPIVRRVIFIPGVPRLIARMAQWLPKRPVRGATGDLQCSWDDCDTSYAANAARYYKAPKGGRDVQRALQEALGRVPVAKTDNAAVARTVSRARAQPVWGS